ncbi:hypothetical protein GN958_ATG09074 [Phytophthora infestans]|uniref:Uncharacterized protein n=1 Tax=Phytophthora infestans TaxID=4787 RepID=A0A8S9URR3_PHYIN|nr:hypothetical protein GN958_ATG09074 [Phytophthora infestans]
MRTSVSINVYNREPGVNVSKPRFRGFVNYQCKHDVHQERRGKALPTPICGHERVDMQQGAQKKISGVNVSSGRIAGLMSEELGVQLCRF